MEVGVIALALALGLGVGCSRHRDPRDDERPAAADATGVAECDEYLARYEACLEKMAGAAGEAPRQALRAQRETLRSTAANGSSRAGLKKTCRQLMEGLAQNAACR
jgi:hypothetical protein